MKRRLLFAVVGCIMAGTLGTMAQNAPADAGKEKPEPEGVKVGTGSLTVSGLLQAWYEFTDSKMPEDTFRLRRAEVKLSGAISPAVSWAIAIDPANVREDDTKSSDIGGTSYVTSTGRKSLLQDVLITFKPCPYSSVDIGQYKTPFGMEGLESSSKLDLIERSMMASTLKWADYRDIGVTCKGDFKICDIAIQPAVGAYNGDGPNKLDANNPMAYAARLVVKPVGGLHLGVAHYNGESGPDKTSNKRTGAEIKFAMDPFTVYGEYAAGEADGKDKEAYYVTATCNVCDSIQAVARYDRCDPNKDNDTDARRETSIGLNYFIKKHNAKIALNYVFRGEEAASATVDDDVVRALAQVSF